MELNIKIPVDICFGMKLPEREKKTRILVEFAIILYEREILSFGIARKLSKLSKEDFHNELGKRKIVRHYTKECFDEDFKYSVSRKR